jgi:hypothetical protein
MEIIIILGIPFVDHGLIGNVRRLVRRPYKLVGDYNLSEDPWWNATMGLLERLSRRFLDPVQFMAYGMHCDAGYTTPPPSLQSATATIDHGTVLVDRRPMHCRLANKRTSHERIAASCGSIFGMFLPNS